MDIFDFFVPSLRKNRFWGRNLKNLSPDLESTSPRYFEFLSQNWGSCPITCNILVLITSRVLQRAKWRLKRDGWRWIELGGGEWSCVEVDGVRWKWMELVGGVGGGGCTVYQYSFISVFLKP